MTRESVPENAAAAPEKTGAPEGDAAPPKAEPASLQEDAIRVMKRLTNRLIIANIVVICALILILAYQFFWSD